MASRELFPEGLRILVVDGDCAALNKLEKILNKMKYKVWACNSAREAIWMLGEKNEKYEFDVVMSDVNMSDMDGFEFLDHVALVANIPMIIMSKDGETSNVMKGVQHGACNYLLKPIRTKDVQHIWIHSFLKRINQIEGGGEEDNVTTKIGENGLVVGMKRKELIESGNKRDGECEVGSSSSVKRPRFTWTDEVHQKFVKAVEIIGLNKATPKKILELLKLMGETDITRDNVSSHFQKFRDNKKKPGQKEPATQASADIALQQQESGFLPPTSMYQDMMVNGNYEHNNNIDPSDMGPIDQFFEPAIQMPLGIQNSQVQFDQFQMQQVQFESRMPQANLHHVQNSQAYFEPQMLQQVDHHHIQNSQVYLHEPQMQQVDHTYIRNADVVAPGSFSENGFNCPPILRHDVPPFCPQNQIYPPNASNTVPSDDFDSEALIFEYLNNDPDISPNLL